MILVNPYGAIGVAVGMASGMIIQQLSMLGFVRLKCGYWTHADIRFINRKIRNILTRRLVA
jgi:hypothetical protein